jgi:hypothetical protein
MTKKTEILELLIIIVVVTILGWITYGQFELAKAKSRDIDRKNSLNDFSKTIKLYFADYGKLPPEKEINELWGKEWKDGNYVYLKTVPKENYLDKKYCYQIGVDGKGFSLFADLENKFDIECKKETALCGGNNYCFWRLFETEVIK